MLRSIIHCIVKTIQLSSFHVSTAKEESSGRKSKLKDSSEEPKAVPAKRKATSDKKVGFDRGLIPEEIIGKFLIFFLDKSQKSYAKFKFLLMHII